MADVYAAINYYLQHRSDVETYLRERQEAALRVRGENEARWDPAGIRERLLARRIAAASSGSQAVQSAGRAAAAHSG